MTIKQAEALKKAGYPQDKAKCAYTKFIGGAVAITCVGERTKRDVAAPTLEELIKELGDKLWGLIKIDDVWFTNYEQGALLRFFESSDSQGKTPIEAVMNLYVKLQDVV